MSVKILGNALRLEKKLQPSPLASILIPVVSVLLALVLGGIFLLLTGYSPLEVYQGMLYGAFGSAYGLSETVVKAATRSYLAGVRPMRIKKDDIHLYGQKSFAPIDTLISIDCSGSMVGEKIRAVSYLAEHFLLTSREKVSLVTFQETASRVVTPFTKSYQKLQEGLRSLQPEGMTPLAKGIVESVELIKKKRARNPLMILITDGIPNFPLWTMDAQADALKAAEMIAEAKIRLVCIGVIPNEEFMRELARVSKGNLYIVDELDKNSLLDVVTHEWQRYKYSKG